MLLEDEARKVKPTVSHGRGLFIHWELRGNSSSEYWSILQITYLDALKDSVMNTGKAQVWPWKGLDLGFGFNFQK